MNGRHRTELSKNKYFKILFYLRKLSENTYFVKMKDIYIFHINTKFNSLYNQIQCNAVIPLFMHMTSAAGLGSNINRWEENSNKVFLSFNKDFFGGGFLWRSFSKFKWHLLFVSKSNVVCQRRDKLLFSFDTLKH